MTPACPAPLPIRIVLPVAVGLGLFFLFFPEVDLWVSSQFFDPAQGFVFKNLPFFQRAKNTVPVLAGLLAGGSLAVLLASFWPGKPAWRARRRPALFVLLVMLLGPGLVVNTVLKDQWGRARPAQVTEFGGEDRFTPAFVISDQCDRNCAFVSGDASVGFALVALAFVSRHRRRWLIASFAVGGFYSLMRLGQGGHFLSDVSFAFFAVYLTAWLLACFVLRPAPPCPGSSVGAPRAH